MIELENYERVHESLAHKAAIKRERDLLEGIAPAIHFLERKMADTTEALDGLKRVRAKALAEIIRLETPPLDEESANAAIGYKTEFAEPEST